MSLIAWAVFTPTSSLFLFMREQTHVESSRSFHFLRLVSNKRNAVVSWLLWRASQSQCQTMSTKPAHDSTCVLLWYYTPAWFVWFEEQTWYYILDNRSFLLPLIPSNSQSPKLWFHGNPADNDMKEQLSLWFGATHNWMTQIKQIMPPIMRSVVFGRWVIRLI